MATPERLYASAIKVLEKHGAVRVALFGPGGSHEYYGKRVQACSELQKIFGVDLVKIRLLEYDILEPYSWAEVWAAIVEETQCADVIFVMLVDNECYGAFIEIFDAIKPHGALDRCWVFLNRDLKGRAKALVDHLKFLSEIGDLHSILFDQRTLDECTLTRSIIPTTFAGAVVAMSTGGAKAPKTWNP